ncbi:MAG: choice-of-anchor R domain-containing protein [Candidatus Micrarchaeota archaeon]
MKNLILALAILLFFGCTGNTPVSDTPQLQLGPTIEECTLDYTFSQISTVTLGETTDLIATIDCGAGETYIVKLDGVEVASATLSTNDTTVLNLGFAPSKDGTVQMTIENNGIIIQAKSLYVAPIGNNNTAGSDTDGVSFKEWRAVAIETDANITPARIRIYMKRLASSTDPNNMMVVELRADNNGNPGPLVSTVKKPTNAATLTENWINFDFAQQQEIPAGKYWIVMKVEQGEEKKPVSDVFYVHYNTIDKNNPGNEYTKEMSLSVDSKTSIATETQWQPLSYNREYSIILTTSK